jgi:hypothetical protein
MSRSPCIALILALCLPFGALGLENGLSRKPALGYNTWNCFGPNSES